MPGIKINFEFDSKAFETFIAITAIDPAVNGLKSKDTNDIVTLSGAEEKEMSSLLQSFASVLRGNTTIGLLRVSLWRAVQQSSSKYFRHLKGIDLSFGGLSLNDRNADLLIDISGLWTDSTIICKPTLTAFEFTDAFLNHSDLHRNEERLQALIWNVLNESVEFRNVKIWDHFCATVFHFWSDLKNMRNANRRDRRKKGKELVGVGGTGAWPEVNVFLDLLLKFDPNPLRSFAGWKLLNVCMGTTVSISVLDELMISDDILWEMDAEKSNALMHIVLDNDLAAMTKVLEFGIDPRQVIDGNSTAAVCVSVIDFALIYGTVEMSALVENDSVAKYEKLQIVTQHPSLRMMPMDVLNEICGFLLGRDTVAAAPAVTDAENAKEVSVSKESDTFLDELEASVMLAGFSTLTVNGMRIRRGGMAGERRRSSVSSTGTLIRFESSTNDARDVVPSTLSAFDLM